jgi:hypothetical protein
MLFRFHSKHAAYVFMLPDLTQKLFDIMGRTLDARGIFLVEQLPDAIARLEKAIATDQDLRIKAPNLLTDAQREYLKTEDRLGQRAHPLLELLKRAQADREYVTWET